ncbi:MAG: hypothetical protein WAX69_09140 [Victivallales bacterium]
MKRHDLLRLVFASACISLGLFELFLSFVAFYVVISQYFFENCFSGYTIFAIRYGIPPLVGGLFLIIGGGCILFQKSKILVLLSGQFAFLSGICWTLTTEWNIGHLLSHVLLDECGCRAGNYIFIQQILLISFGMLIILSSSSIIKNKLFSSCSHVFRLNREIDLPKAIAILCVFIAVFTSFLLIPITSFLYFKLFWMHEVTESSISLAYRSTFELAKSEEAFDLFISSFPTFKSDLKTLMNASRYDWFRFCWNEKEHKLEDIVLNSSDIPKSLKDKFPKAVRFECHIYPPKNANDGADGNLQVKIIMFEVIDPDSRVFRIFSKTANRELTIGDLKEIHDIIKKGAEQEKL